MPSSKDYDADIETSLKVVHSQLDEMEAAGIPSTKVVLGGFSQVGSSQDPPALINSPRCRPR